MFRARRWLADWLAGGAIGALVFAWFGHAFLNYDTFYALVWGGDLAHGRTPEYSVPVAPTPHPLAELVGIVLSPFRGSAEDLMLAIGLLALGLLVVGVFRLGQELFGTWAGLLAATIIATRVPILNYGIRGYVDLPTAAFVVWAAVLEARTPRRGAPVLVLLGLAGLLRPEAWLYAGAYWLWLASPVCRGVTPSSRGTALRLLPLAIAAPVIWALSDLAITGDALHSLTGTHDLAAQLGRKTGLGALPSVAPRRLGEILRLPELLAAVVGFCFALAFVRRRLALPVAVAALNGLAYTAFAIARLPLLGRYLFVAAAMLAVLAGAGALGWLALPPGDTRRRAWAVAGAAALAAIVVFFPLQQVDRLNVLKDDIAARDRIQADLHELVDANRGALDRCRTVYVQSHRPVPLIAYWADKRPQRIVVSKANPTRPCSILPANKQVAALAILDPHEPATAPLPAIRGPAMRNRSWVFTMSTP
jgi:hypothetical protein